MRNDVLARCFRRPAIWVVLAALTLSASLMADSSGDGALESALTEARDSGELLSAVAALRTDGDVQFLTLGQLAPETDAMPSGFTAYQIGSITKAFTNLLLAEMVAREQVAYDTTVGELIGDEIDFANEDVADITLQELATHTSGLPRLPANLNAGSTVDPYANYDEAALREALASVREGQPLGKGYAYSNLGLGLLGHLLGQVHGGGYEAALAELVLEPLEFEQTGFSAASPSATGFSGGEATQPWTFDALAGAGALWSSAVDLMRLSNVQLGLVTNPLAHDLADDRKVVVQEAGAFRLSRVWHMADTDSGPVYWHNGATSGFRTFFGFRPDTDEALALLIAGDTDPLALASDWFDFSRPESGAPEIEEAVTGQYRLTPQVGIGIFAGDNGLMAQLSGQPPARLERVEEDWFAINVADASLHIVRQDGEVVAVELVQNGMTQRAEKVADRATVLSREEVTLDADALDAYTGEYELAPQARFTIRRSDDGLEARLTGQPFFPIFPRGDDVFFYKVVDAELHFERDENGEVDAVVLHQGGIEQRAERVD
jgi:CubicO group peptidase (beta-lactamase class C family)